MVAALRLERDPAILGPVTLFTWLQLTGMRACPTLGSERQRTLELPCNGQLFGSGRGAWLQPTYMAESA
jgi:hypothetical protein